MYKKKMKEQYPEVGPSYFASHKSQILAFKSKPSYKCLILGFVS